MNPSFLVLLPAVLVLAIAYITQRLNTALIVGLISSALIACNFAPIVAASLIFKRFSGRLSDVDNLYIYSFLIVLGVIIALLEHTGSTVAFARILTRHLRSSKIAQSATALLSTSFFIDDYLSCLTTGYVMRPITDSFSITRTKLAFIIHSLSGPLVILAPLSSWIAIIISELDQAGINTHMNESTKVIADPFAAHLQTIPFIFYSLLLIASVWIIIRLGISYGPMGREEKIAATTGNLFGGQPPIAQSNTQEIQPNASAWDLIIPLCILIAGFLAGVAYQGNYFLFGGQNTFLQALQNSQTNLILLISGTIALLVVLGVAFFKKTVSSQILPSIAYAGFNLTWGSIVMVVLASTLGVMFREDLLVGTYLAQMLQGSLKLFMLPVAFYFTSIAISIFIGSALATITLMVPIALPMLMVFLQLTPPVTLEQIPFLLPILGAIFSGAVCGNHISPIADTTIMSANSAGCYPMAHVITQFWYALPAILGAGIAFVVSGLCMSYPFTLGLAISLASGFIGCILIMVILSKIVKQ